MVNVKGTLEVRKLAAEIHFLRGLSGYRLMEIKVMEQLEKNG
jgi:hypothetical protein